MGYLTWLRAQAFFTSKCHAEDHPASIPHIYVARERFLTMYMYYYYYSNSNSAIVIHVLLTTCNLRISIIFSFHLPFLTQSYGDEMEANIRNIIVNEPDPVVREVAKKMLDSVQTAHPNRLYQPDLLTRKILYAGFRMLPDEITDFWLTEISGLMKA